jgi:hypothetical protein
VVFLSKLNEGHFYDQQPDLDKVVLGELTNKWDNKKKEKYFFPS